MKGGDSHQQDLSILHLLRWWVPLTSYPEDTCFDDDFVIHPQRQHRGSTGRCQANDMCAAVGPGKMILPPMKTWVEERRQFPCHGIQIVGLAALEFVTAVAGSTKIIEIIAAAKHFGQNMVNNQGHSNHATRGATVFAAMIRAIVHLLAYGFREGGHG